MKKMMPQEIEVWYLIPAIRREIAKIFIEDDKLTQKRTAEILGVSEAAISQYFKSKRAKEIKFSKKELVEIKKVAEKIVDNPDCLMEGLYDLSTLFRKSKTICELHRAMDSSVSEKCTICLDKN